MGRTRGGAGSLEDGQVYRCFLVRCRLEGTGPGGEPAWRFTVQQAAPDTPRHSFTCLDDVAAHLQVELRSCAALSPGRQAALATGSSTVEQPGKETQYGGGHHEDQ